MTCDQSFIFKKPDKDVRQALSGHIYSPNKKTSQLT